MKIQNREKIVFTGNVVKMLRHAVSFNYYHFITKSYFEVEEVPGGWRLQNETFKKIGVSVTIDVPIPSGTTHISVKWISDKEAVIYVGKLNIKGKKS